MSRPSAPSDYLPEESGISAETAIRNILGILDDREFLKIQDEARELLGTLVTAD